MRTSLRFVVLATVLSSVGAATAQEQHEEFGYTGPHGPAKWGQTHGWEACAGGPAGRQSPVAIRHATIVKTLAPVTLDTHETAVALTNNGHTIEQEYESGSVVTVGGARYELAQFHFHSPSEHTIAGRRAALELHAVFADPKSTRKVVIAQLLRLVKAVRSWQP